MKSSYVSRADFEYLRLWDVSLLPTWGWNSLVLLGACRLAVLVLSWLGQLESLPLARRLRNPGAEGPLSRPTAFGEYITVTDSRLADKGRVSIPLFPLSIFCLILKLN